MYFTDNVTLRTVTTSQDSDGYAHTVNTDVAVFGDVKSASRAEFYAANANGINAVLEVDIHSEDWNNATQIVYNSAVYYIVRSYQKGLGVISLTCSDKAV